MFSSQDMREMRWLDEVPEPGRWRTDRRFLAAKKDHLDQAGWEYENYARFFTHRDRQNRPLFMGHGITRRRGRAPAITSGNRAGHLSG
jgi:hypothetical protein